MKKLKKILKKINLKKFFYYKRVCANNNIVICDKDKSCIDMKIRGKNNIIKIGKLNSCAESKITINVYGDNNEIFIDGNVYCGKLDIIIGVYSSNFAPVTNAKIYIGQSTTIEDATFALYNSNSEIEIGERCMFAYGIVVYNTDAHPIFDLDSKKIINKVGKLKICKHCWIGAHSTILKNSIISDDSIIGYGSVVSGKFSKSNVAIAGNPAKVIKENIMWDNVSNKGYVQNEPEL